MSSVRSRHPARRPRPGCPSGRASTDRMGGMALSDRDRAILELERDWWLDAGTTKEAAIRARLGLSATRYRELLNELLDDPDALAFAPPAPPAPAFVPPAARRPRRLRERNRKARFEGRSAGEPPRR